MTGTDLCVNKTHLSRSYLNHLVNNCTVQAECRAILMLNVVVHIVTTRLSRVNQVKQYMH